MDNPAQAEKKKPLRDEMPMTAWFIDFARAVFGKENVDPQVRRGLNGEPVFWASENGKEIGTRDEDRK